VTHSFADDAVEQLHGPWDSTPRATPRLRLFSEDVPLAALGPETLSVLAERRVELLIAAPPERLDALPRLAADAAAAGARLGVWPLLHEVAGRYPNADQLDAFERQARRAIQAIRSPAGAERGGSRRGPTVVVDLEPPMSLLRLRRPGPTAVARVARWARGNLARSGAARRRLTVLVDALRREGAGQVVATVLPVVRPVGVGRTLGSLLGTPIDGVPFDAVFPMAYTSLAEGYLPGLGRSGAERLLTQVVRRGGPAVALGIVGGGALGDERPYRGPGELVRDVALARAAGAVDLALHGLDGMWSQEAGLDAAWLDAFVGAAVSRSPSPPAPGPGPTR
jgi:hypothetical protein